MVLFARAGIVSIVKIVKNHELIYEDNRDSYVAGVVSTLASMKVSCTINATSIPFFRPLIRRISGKDSSYHSAEGGVASPMSGSRQNSYTKKQEAGNAVSVRGLESGQRTPNYFRC